MPSHVSVSPFFIFHFSPKKYVTHCVTCERVVCDRQAGRLTDFQLPRLLYISVPWSTVHRLNDVLHE